MDLPAKKVAVKKPAKKHLARPGALRATPLKGQLSGLVLEAPISHKNLKLYPVSADQPFVKEKIHTIDAAFKGKLVAVTEQGSGTVPFISLQKTSKEHVFIMTGEMFVGARQDRISKHDVLLPKKAGKHRLPVYCVEQGRWHGNTQAFKSGNVLSTNKLRKSAIKKGSQGKIWEEVSKKTKQVKATTPTQTMHASYKSETYKKKSPPYLKKLAGFASRYPKSLGVVVVINSTVVSVDIFANHELFVALSEKLLKSYVLDAVDPHFKGSNYEAARIHEFLAQVASAKFAGAKSPGMGKEFVITSPEVAGTLLKAKNRIVHFALLAEKEGRKRVFDSGPKVPPVSKSSQASQPNPNEDPFSKGYRGKGKGYRLWKKLRLRRKRKRYLRRKRRKARRSRPWAR
jgi:hypothetical protein